MNKRTTIPFSSINNIWAGLGWTGLGWAQIFSNNKIHRSKKSPNESISSSVPIIILLLFTMAGKRSGLDSRRIANHSSSSEKLSLLTRGVNSVFSFVRFAEFEILFVLFFLVAFLLFKDLTSRPEYNQILVRKPGGPDWWPY